MTLPVTILDPASAASLLPALLEHAARSAILVGAAFLATRLLRHRSASVRHAIWASTFAAIVLLPVGMRTLPDWGVLPARMSTALESVRVETLVDGAIESVSRSARELPIVLGRQARSSTGAATGPAQADPARASGASSDPAAPDPARAAAGSSPDESAATGGTATARSPVYRLAPTALRGMLSRAKALSTAQWLVLLWLAGVAWNLFRQARSALQVRRIVRGGHGPTDSIRDLSDRAAARLGLRRPVDVRLSSGVPMPATWGDRRAVLLLPAEARKWETDRMWHVLLHEMAHVYRRDHAVQTVVRAVCGLFWFNPFVWPALRALRAESEVACDDLVVLSGSTASRYANHLVEVARSVRDASDRLPAAALAMAHPSRLEGRVRSILDPRTSRRPMKTRHALLSLAAVLLVAVPVAAAAPQVAPPAPKPPKAPAPVADALPASPAPAPDAVPLPPAPAPVPAVLDVPAAPMAATAPDAPPLPPAAPAPPAPAPAPVTPGLAQALPLPDAPPVAPARADTIRNRARIVAAFVKALEDPDPELRSQAALALAELEADEAVEPLGRLLADDEDPDVRRAALHALGELDPAAAFPVIMSRFRTETDPELRRHMLWVMAESGDASALPAVESALEDRDPEVRKAALAAMMELGTADAVPLLVKALDDPEPENQRMAIFALAEVAESGKAPEAAEAGLVRASRSPDPEVRRAAIFALSESGSRAAIQALSAATSDADPEVRRHAIWSIAESDSPEVASILSRALQDEDPEVRRYAIHALSERGDALSAEAMARALEDRDPEVRRAAIWSVAESGTDDAATVNRLASVLDRDSDPEVRKHAAYALGEIGGDVAVDALTRALDDADPEVRKAAIAALASLVGGS